MIDRKIYDQMDEVLYKAGRVEGMRCYAGGG